MRRTLFLAFALAISLPVTAAWYAPYTYRYEMRSCPDGYNPGMCIGAQSCTAGTCTGTAPTGPSEGMLLPGVVSYRLRICAAPATLSDGGTTTLVLAGGGTMQAYFRDEAEGAWMRNPGLDQTVSATTGCQVFPDVLVGAQIGRVRYVASGVTVSDGGTLTDGGASFGSLDVLLDGYGVQN